MFILLGLLCTTPGDASTCQVLQYGNPIPTIEVCEATGTAQLNTQTPYGLVVSYTCKPAGEMT